MVEHFIIWKDWEKCGGSYMHWSPSYKIPPHPPPPIPWKNSTLSKSHCNQKLTSVLLTLSPTRLETNSLKVFYHSWSTNSKSCSPSSSFYTEDEHRIEAKSLSCSCFVYITKTHSGTILPKSGSKGERWEEYPVKLPSDQFQILVKRVIGFWYIYKKVLQRYIWKGIYGKYCKPSYFSFVSICFQLHPKLYLCFTSGI